MVAPRFHEHSRGLYVDPSRRHVIPRRGKNCIVLLRVHGQGHEKFVCNISDPTPVNALGTIVDRVSLFIGFRGFQLFSPLDLEQLAQSRDYFVQKFLSISNLISGPLGGFNRQLDSCAQRLWFVVWVHEHPRRCSGPMTKIS
jgi:hypothetical protein